MTRKEKRNLQSRKYYAKNKDRQNARRRANYRQNKQRDLKRGVARVMERYHSDIQFRLKWLMQGIVQRACTQYGVRKSALTMDLLGCSTEFLKGYLEGQFQKGMSWDNYGKGQGKWQIDHVMPICSFDLSVPQEQRRCFHYTNLQPLWAPDNNRKHNTIPASHQPNLL
jgi:hypothetical protein